MDLSEAVKYSIIKKMSNATVIHPPGVMEACVSGSTITVLMNNMKTVQFDEVAMGSFEEYFSKVTETIQSTQTPISSSLQNIVKPIFARQQEQFMLLPEETREYLKKNHVTQ